MSFLEYPPPRRYLRFILVGVVVALLLYWINYNVTPDLIGPNRLEIFCRPRGNLKFDSKLWKDSPYILERSKRYEMVDDLLSRSLLIGLNESGIQRLIGHPNTSNDTNGVGIYVYYLARQKDYPAKSIWFPGQFPNHEAWMLEIIFKGGKATSARVFFD